MGKKSLCLAAMLLAGANLASAQTPDGAPPPVKALAPTPAVQDAIPATLSVGFGARPAEFAPSVLNESATCSDGERMWASAEYLLWWLKAPRVPTLVSTGSLLDAVPAAVGQPGTVALFGGTLDNELRQGGKFAAGYWLADDHSLGIDAGAFFIARRSVDFSVASGGLPILALPYFDVLAQKQNAVPRLASPGVDAGAAQGSVSTRLWGYETNLRSEMINRSGLRIDALIGFRYADLSETLELDGQTKFEPDVPMFGGNETLGTNTYSTRNFFYGGQIGGVAVLERGNLSLAWTAKLAIGGTLEITNISGTTQGISPTGVGHFAPIGQYALPTNIGRYSSSQFSVIPETSFTVGYQVTQRLRATVGYDFLAWSNVLRAGDQVDTVLNTSQIPPPLGAGVLTGPARPTYLGKETDFWAQGVNLGLEFRY
jgi:hypothetical protein